MYSGTIGIIDLPNFTNVRRELADAFTREEILAMIKDCEFGRASGITFAVLPANHQSQGWEKTGENEYLKTRTLIPREADGDAHPARRSDEPT